MRPELRSRDGIARVRADATEVITVAIPEWQIIDDETWLRAQEGFAVQAPGRKQAMSRAKYALAGIARCGTCDGSVGCATTRQNGQYVKTYACIKNHQRGPRACPVTVRQGMDDVEEALIGYVSDHILSPDMIDRFAGQVRGQVEAQIPSKEADREELEAELREVKAEQKRLTKAVALTDEVAELVTELRNRATRARHLEARIAGIRRAPGEQRAVVDKAEAAARSNLGDIRRALLSRTERRQVFLRLFPEGIRLHPARVQNHQVWKVEGAVNLARLAEAGAAPFTNTNRDPKGT